MTFRAMALVVAALVAAGCTSNNVPTAAGDPRALTVSATDSAAASALQARSDWDEAKFLRRFLDVA